MFWGNDVHALDKAGSMTLPARWREQLGLSVVITRGLDRCLFLYPADKFASMARELERLTFAQADARALSRYLFAGAIDAEPDNQGNISISPELRHYAGIEQDAVLVGVNDRIEIWNPQRYAEVDALVESNVDAVAERMGAVLQQPAIRE